jgi:hypothetical protein
MVSPTLKFSLFNAIFRSVLDSSVGSTTGVDSSVDGAESVSMLLDVKLNDVSARMFVS